MIHGTYLVSTWLLHFPKASFSLSRMFIKSLNFDHRFIENRGEGVVLLCAKGKEAWEWWEAEQDNGKRILESNGIGS